MPIDPTLLLIPAALLFAGRKKKPSRANKAAVKNWESNPYGLSWKSRDHEISGTEDGLPLSDRMVLNKSCTGPATKVIRWRYDIRITNYFWYMVKQEGIEDPLVLAAEILYYDSPNCEWPPHGGSSQWAHVIWDGTYRSVATYYNLWKSGRLHDYAWDRHNPHQGMYVKPLVVWT